MGWMRTDCGGGGNSSGTHASLWDSLADRRVAGNGAKPLLGVRKYFWKFPGPSLRLGSTYSYQRSMFFFLCIHGGGHVVRE
jgi:hypothetical protein